MERGTPAPHYPAKRTRASKRFFCLGLVVVKALPCTQNANRLSFACLRPLGRRPSGYGPASACRAEAQRAKAELPQTGGLHVVSARRQFKWVKGEECEARPLTRLNWHNTIDARFCVNIEFTKTVPKRLGGGG
jgi:hypothetical protein